jgi:hypothetical protein
MSSYRTFGRLDDEPLVDGDAGFIGVDERDPALIGKGLVSRAVNYEFRDGVARPRKGNVPLGFLNDNSSWPIVWPWSFEYPRPLGDVRGAGVFQDPNGLEWILIATATNVYAAREGNPVRSVSWAAHNTPAGDVRFVQAFNDMLVFFGEDATPQRLSDIFGAFATISQVANTITGATSENPSDGTEQIPNAESAIWMQNRLFIPYGRDLIAASDYLNYTRYSAVRSQFRINQGSEDRLLALYKFGESSLAAFKQQSVYLVGNLTGDLADIAQEELTREYGLAAAKAVCSVGNDVWFLSQRGVTSIGQTQQNKVQGTSTTWSDPIFKTMGRINWIYAHRACATFYDGKFYLALPLDDATVTNAAGTNVGVNNAVLIYDFANGAWWGTQQGENILVRDWVQFKWMGKRRLGYLSDDGWVCLWGHGFSDTVRMDSDGVMQAEIETELVTRGYTFPQNESGDAKQGAANRTKILDEGLIVLNTWRPRFTVEAIVSSGRWNTMEPARSSLVSAQTKSRTRYRKPFGKARWNPSNVNDDWGTPNREDYSVDSDPGNGGIAPLSGVNFEQHQETTQPVRVKGRCRFVQARITNDQGRAEVKGIELNAVAERGRRVGK